MTLREAMKLCVACPRYDPRGAEKCSTFLDIIHQHERAGGCQCCGLPDEWKRVVMRSDGVMVTR
jgi:hypothetical protein